MEGLQTTIMTWLDSEVVVPVALDWGFRLLGAALLFVIGYWITKALIAWLRRVLLSPELDEMLTQFSLSLVYIVLLVLVVLTALSALGINTMIFLAIFGAVSFAISLALIDSLSNFAALSGRETLLRRQEFPVQLSASEFSTLS